jgi:Rab-GTPase-TBC domain
MAAQRHRAARALTPSLPCRSWINCLLIREVPFSLATRLWDTYLAEGSRLKGFLIYVAAAFLLSWSGPLRTMDFQVHIDTFLFQPCSTHSCHDASTVRVPEHTVCKARCMLCIDS